MYRKVFLILVFTVWLSACVRTSQPTTEIMLGETDFAYSPTSVTVPVGKPITLTIKNNGKVEHDFVIQKINVIDVVKQDDGMNMGHDMTSMEYDLHASTQPGESNVITFTPAEAGTYEFFCTVEGHKEAGMIGELIVVEE